MAFKDITKVLYNGQVKIDYKDKAHRYYARMRKNWDLPESDKNAWDRILYPKGTTTLLGDTLEKKGLMTWPMGLALRSLFGFYDFTNDNGDRMTGFSKETGTLWAQSTSGETIPWLKDVGTEELLPLVLAASKAWQDKQKKGADIGSVVHDAIEHFVRANPNSTTREPEDNVFDIGEQYLWGIKESWPEPGETETDEFEAERKKAMEEFPADVAQAEAAFAKFQDWWNDKKPELLGAEDLIYSLKYNICGTFDGLIKLDGQTILCDWKTSNASKSEAACMPEGINYQYFIQSALYAMAWMEMGYDHIDDLMIVSCRKDGGFTTITASELGLSVQECIDWACATITCYTMMDRTKKGLWQHGIDSGEVILKKKGSK